MENLLYSTENKKNNRIVAYLIYLYSDFIYLGFISFITFVIYKLTFKFTSHYSDIWPFILLILIALYGYINHKITHKYHVPIIRINSNGIIEMIGYRGFKQIHEVLNIQDVKYYFLIEGNLSNSSNCVVFIRENNENINYWNSPDEVYEILHQYFPDNELPKKKILRII